MWYTKKVRPDVENLERYSAVNMSRPGPEHWKALRRLIGYLKGKKTKGVVIRNPKSLKAVCFAIIIMPQTNRKEIVSAV